MSDVETTYGVAMGGTCPACGVQVLASGSGIPEEHRPDGRPGAGPEGRKRLGDAVELRCICGTAFAGRVVGLVVDPYRVTTEDDDDGPSCRVCGCTDEAACFGGCSWVPDPEGGDLCSACADDDTLRPGDTIDIGELDR